MDPKQQISSKLSSYSSAPSSFLTSLVDQTNYVRASSHEVETTFDTFISSTCNDIGPNNPARKQDELEKPESLVRSKTSLGIGSSLADFSTDNNGFAAMRGDLRVDNDRFNFYMPWIDEAGNKKVGISDSERRNIQSCGYFDGSENGFNIMSTSTASTTWNIEFGNWSGGLTHHSSLPKDFSKGDRERVLDFQGSVPCNVRAKRGFATHPRSIAERNRRIRINERIRKLEDLFPNLDKQANTSLKLDLVLEFIKDLQKQIKILKDTKAKCLCSSIKRHHPINPSSA